MSNYGRNFEFRASPHRNQRAGRYVLDEGSNLPIGVPVVVPALATEDSMKRLPVELATGATDIPKAGLGGILVYEHAPDWAAGYDTGGFTTFSDIDYAPDGKSVQVVYGDDVKVAYRNTFASDFYTRSNYPKARIMVAGVGPTNTVSVGDFLTPGVGTDADGYWAVTVNVAEAWLTVLSVNGSTGEVEAQLNF